MAISHLTPTWRPTNVCFRHQKRVFGFSVMFHVPAKKFSHLYSVHFCLKVNFTTETTVITV